VIADVNKYCKLGFERLTLFRRYISAGLAARGTIEKPIFAEPYADFALTQAAVLLASALGFRLVALHAAVGFSSSCTWAHTKNLAPAYVQGKVPEVIGIVKRKTRLSFWERS
jgi:hypothetical protein